MKRIIFCLLTFMVLSRSKTIEPSLGLYPVYFEVNLNTEWRLQASQASKIFTEKNTNQHDARFGLGGILVYNGFSNNGGSQNLYYAFDAACPYEASSNVTVEVQDGVFAVCPKCGSKYDISNGVGNPMEGPATKVLQHYRVDQTDKTLLIRNY